MTTVNDPIYDFAKNIVIDNVASSIIATPEFTRLRGIMQSGITGLFTGRSYDRAEHSIGVYLILKYLGATSEQCIGGLLHDIYHTNFSHTTDELFCGESQDSFHEKNKYIFFDKCCQNISHILTTAFPSRSINYFLDGENMLVTKNKSFGADMLDYFMRDGFYEGMITHDWISSLVTKLKLVGDRIILSDVQMAKDFFAKTIYINDNVYMSPFSRGQYKIFMNILKIALDTQVISNDIIVYGYSSDVEIYEHIKQFGNLHIQELIQLLETTTEYSFEDCTEHTMKKTKTKVSRKLRFLNPLCENDTTAPMHVSEIDKNVEQTLTEKKLQYTQKKDLYFGSSLPIGDSL